MKAMYETGTSFARSDEQIVSPSAGSNTLNLNLTNTGTLPDSISVTFSATNQKTITLSDGTTINIPSGVLASSGNVTVTVDPKAQLPNQSLATPIDIGYDIKAFDANGNEITGNFNSNVTIVIPYTDAELTALGITEDDLVPSYWDSTTSTWKAASNISIDKDNNTVTITINHFTDFALVSAGKTGTTSTTTSSTTSSVLGASPPGCGKAAPATAPWLYGAIAQGSDSVKLYFTDADGPLDKYVLQFGLKSGDYIFGSDGIGGLGMRTYLVQHLTPKTMYYFRVRAGNDCAIGPWSNEISAKTKARYSLSSLEFLSSELETVKKKERGMECFSYTVRSGDNLWSIAKQLLNDGARFKEIIELNKEKYSSLTSSNMLTIGWELDIECKEMEEEGKEGASQAKLEREEGEEKVGYVVNIKVVDPEGKPVVGANVLLYSKPKEMTTNKDGIARFTSVEKGYHKVVVAFSGYKGEQSINLTGDVEEFNLTITVSKTTNYSLIVVGLGVGILLGIILLFLLRKGKAKHS